MAGLVPRRPPCAPSPRTPERGATRRWRPSCRAQADGYAAAVEAHGWDGEWYRRAYFDDGTPLGSAASDECRIDSIAQSWSVISGAGAAGAPGRRRCARSSSTWCGEDARLLMLLTPPFDKTPHDPGYIKGYLPGVRENGAQYTHAALWAVLATALRGDGDRAFELFQMINPLTHARTPEEVATYKVEPYVVAADVYTAERPRRPRRLDLVHRLGELDVPGGAGGDPRLHQAGRDAGHPALRAAGRGPSSRSSTGTEGAVTPSGCARPAASGVGVWLDGRKLEGDAIPLADDGAEHTVEVVRA